MPNWERLKAMDAIFLDLEDGNAHMHVAGVMTLEPGAFELPDGRLDGDSIREFVESKLHLVPRYRQKLAFVPVEDFPVWIDDDRFNIDYHIRLTALPRPGGEKELQAFAGRILSQMLDRSKPLWEMWFVEGYHTGELVMLSKMHHCMADGVAGTDILQALLDPFPEETVPRPVKWIPKPAPNRAQLAFDAVRHRMDQPIENLKATREVIRNPRKAIAQAQDYVESLVEMAAPGLRGATDTPINAPIGPHRRFAKFDMSLNDVKAVKNALGGTVNDVMLAVVAGALQRFFKARRFTSDNLDVRALVPVSIRSSGERDIQNNRIATIIAALPVSVNDPVKRLRKVSQIMGDLKKSKQAIGAERLASVADWTVPNILVQAYRLVANQRGFNLTVSNVPGPQIPLYMKKWVMTGAYPAGPIMARQGLNVTLLSYNGKLCWGLNGDYEIMHDLHLIERFICEALVELQEAAGLTAAENGSTNGTVEASEAPAKKTGGTTRKKKPTKKRTAKSAEQRSASA